MRAGVDMHIAGAGGSVTHTLRARAVMVRKSAGAGRSGMKKTVPRRSLACALSFSLAAGMSLFFNPVRDAKYVVENNRVLSL